MKTNVSTTKRNSMSVTKLDEFEARVALEMEAMTDSIANLIREKRDIKNIRQDQLAEKAKINRSTLIRMEMGRGNPGLETLVRAATAMGYRDIVTGKQIGRAHV